MTIEKLSREEFDRALRLGLGRAILHVREYGDEGVEDLIEEALVSSYAYDMMFEGTRTNWLMTILRHTGEIKKYAARLRERFATCEATQHDLIQQIELSANLFDFGYEEFREIIINKYKLLKSLDASVPSSARCLINTCGFPGFALAASLEIQQNCEETLCNLEWECGQILQCAEDLLPESEVAELLTEWSGQNNAIKAFKDVTDRRKENETSAEVGIEKHNDRITLEDIDSIGSARRFAKTASNVDLLQAFDRLKNCETSHQQILLLAVFSLRDMPILDEKTFSFLQSTDDKVRRAAVKALSRLSSPKVRQLAHESLHSNDDEWIVHGFSLLINNFETDDALDLKQHLQRIVDPDHLHWAGMSVLKLAKKGTNSALASTLLWLLNYGTDPFCRSSFMEQLLDWQECPQSILHEGQWDSYSETQALCRSRLSENIAEVQVEGIEFNH